MSRMRRCFGLNSEQLMWALSQNGQQCTHGLYNARNAPTFEEFSKSEARIRFRRQDYEASDWLG
jgi:phage terminase small subunit